MAIVRVWMFAGFGLPRDNQSFVERLNSLNVTDIVFGVNGDDFDDEVKRGRRVKRLGNSDFHLFHSPDRIVSACQACSAAGIVPHIMTWLHPDEPWMQAVHDILYPIARRAGVASVMLDLEYYWKSPKSTPTRFKKEDFRTTIPESFRRILLPGRNFELGITSYALLPARVKPVMKYVSYGVPQAYSVYNSKKAYTKEEGYRPGRTQRLANSWRGSAPRIIMGLANYWQSHPTGPTEIEALRLALGETIKLGYKEVAYWSLPWVKRDVATFTKGILGTSGGLPVLAARRNSAFASASRRDFQGAMEQSDVRWQAIEVPQMPPITGEFILDDLDFSGLLFNFQTGKWNDEA